jgi:hypothetical protein
MRPTPVYVATLIDNLNLTKYDSIRHQSDMPIRQIGVNLNTIS